MKLLYVIFLITFCQIGQAFDAGADDFKKRARSERHYAPATLLGNNRQPIASGFITPDNRFRIQKLEGFIDGFTSEINSLRAKVGSGQNLVDRCENHRPLVLGLPPKNSYKIKLIAPIFDKYKLENVVDSRTGQIAEMPLGFPATPIFARLHIDYLPGSMVKENSQVDPRLYYNDYNRQIESQMSLLFEKGEIEFDLSDNESLVCDFALGKVNIGLEITWSYPRALLDRTPIISAQEIQNIYERSRQFSLNNESRDDKIAASAALVLSNLITQNRMTIVEFGKDNFLDLHKALFDRTQLSWSRLSTNQIMQLSRDFDKVEQSVTESKSIVLTRFNGVVK